MSGPEEPVKKSKEQRVDGAKKAVEDLEMLRTYQQSILETLEPGILIMDSRDQVITEALLTALCT